ncbi:MAG TPA: DUF4272 domain-containing protein [Steroidobacteraceae bacterium]|jgi:hypothetical protein
MTRFDLTAVRTRSWNSVVAAGLRTNPDLPLLTETFSLEPLESIADRLLCLTAVASFSFGLPLSACRAWLEQEQLWNALSLGEKALLSGEREDLLAGQIVVHSIYALAWCVGAYASFDIQRKLPDDLVEALPDLRVLEPTKVFRSRLSLRAIDMVLEQLDAAYCFHWAWRDRYLTGKSRGTNDMMVLAERRKALEWVVTGGDWDHVSLDT